MTQNLLKKVAFGHKILEYFYMDCTFRGSSGWHHNMYPRFVWEKMTHGWQVNFGCLHDRALPAEIEDISWIVSIAFNHTIQSCFLPCKVLDCPPNGVYGPVFLEYCSNTGHSSCFELLSREASHFIGKACTWFQTVGERWLFYLVLYGKFWQ